MKSDSNEENKIGFEYEEASVVFNLSCKSVVLEDVGLFNSDEILL